MGMAWTLMDFGKISNIHFDMFRQMHDIAILTKEYFCQEGIPFILKYFNKKGIPFLQEGILSIPKCFH